MKRNLSKTLRWAASLSVVILLLTPTIVLAAAENGGIGGKPANPREDNPRSQSIFVYELQPEQTAKDAVEIFNNTEQQKKIKVYATDSVISSGGAFACAQAADPVKDVGNWIQLDKNSVDLAPGKSEKIAFTVTVPDYAEPGEHNGCIAIQEADAEAATVGNGIALSFRSAIRVAITVPGDIKKELTIREVRLANKEPALIGTVLLRNNGNVSLDTTITAQIRGLAGGSRQTISGTYPALPQTITELNFEYKKPYWGGFYRVDVTAEYNSNIAESLGEGSAQQSVEKSSSYTYIIPAPSAMLIQLGLLIGVGVAVWFIWKRYIVQKRQRKQWVQYEVQKDDNIQSLAAELATNWKDIAAINKLKAPYTIPPGSTLLLPSLPAKKTNTTKAKKKTPKSTSKKVKNEPAEKTVRTKKKGSAKSKKTTKTSKKDE
jgi:hypothetical protein